MADFQILTPKIFYLLQVISICQLSAVHVVGPQPHWKRSTESDTCVCCKPHKNRIPQADGVYTGYKDSAATDEVNLSWMFRSAEIEDED